MKRDNLAVCDSWGSSGRPWRIQNPAEDSHGNRSTLEQTFRALGRLRSRLEQTFRALRRLRSRLEQAFQALWRRRGRPERLEGRPEQASRHEAPGSPGMSWSVQDTSEDSHGNICIDTHI